MHRQRGPRRDGPHRGTPAILTAGIDLGGTKCLGVLVDEDGVVVDEHRVPTPASRGRAGVIEAIASVAHELLERRRDIAGIGVGAPGLVDGRGVLRFAPNLPGVVELDLGAGLADLLRSRARIVVENDASCAAWAEREAGAGRDRTHIVLITLGTGIGGGLVLGGRLYRGANGFAGEVGHMVLDPSGPPCPCGQRGCWERFGSGSGLGRLGREAARAGRVPRVIEIAGGSADDVTGEHVTAAAAEGDPGALTVMDEFGWWVARGLVNLANVCDPEAFVIGGGLIAAGDVLLEPVRRHFTALLAGSVHRPPTAIVAAVLGEYAGALGAAFLARP